MSRLYLVLLDGSVSEQLFINVVGGIILVIILACLGVIFVPRLVANQKIKDLNDNLDLVRKSKQDYADAVRAITDAKTELASKYQELTTRYTENLEIQAGLQRRIRDLELDSDWFKQQFFQETGRMPPPRLKVVAAP